MKRNRCGFIGNNFLVEIVPEIYWKFKIGEVDYHGNKRSITIYPNSDDCKKFPKIPYSCEYIKNLTILKYKISKKNLFKLIRLSEKI